MRNPSLGFNPLDPETMKNKKRLKIKIISGQQLQFNSHSGLIKDIIDPYVTISVFGVPADRCEQKTTIVNDNGFNPLWNQDFEFIINCPELAFLLFTVKDHDINQDDFIGDFAIRFQNIRPGKSQNMIK